MESKIQNRYNPDYVYPPGDTLLEVLEERGMTQTELAERIGRPKKTINEIINGKAAITPETALQLDPDFSQVKKIIDKERKKGSLFDT